MSEKIKKTNPLSEGALNALKALKDKPATAADLKANGLEVNSSHLTALVKRGLVEAVEIEVEVPAIVKRKVKLYTINDKGEKELGQQFQKTADLSKSLNCLKLGSV